jgi:hypothetical protein
MDGFFQKARAAHHFVERGADFVEGGVHDRGSGGEDQIVTGEDAVHRFANRFAQEAFGAIPLNGSPNSFSRDHADAGVIIHCGADDQHKKRVRESLAYIPHPLKVA